MAIYYRIQPAGLGIDHASEDSAGDRASLHVLTSPSSVFNMDLEPEGYGDEVVVIEADRHWDNGDVEGVAIDGRRARVVGRIPIDEYREFAEELGFERDAPTVEIEQAFIREALGVRTRVEKGRWGTELVVEDGMMQNASEVIWEKGSGPDFFKRSSADRVATEDYAAIEGGESARERLLSDARHAPGEEAKRFSRAKPKDRPTTETEESVIRALRADPVPLGYISNALLYARPFRYLSAREKQAIYSLFKGGALDVVRTYNPDNYWLVETSRVPNPEYRSGRMLVDYDSYDVRGVLAGAYRGRDTMERPTLTHVVFKKDDHDLRCGCSQPIDNVVDPYGAQVAGTPPTCPRCLKIWEKLPRELEVSEGYLGREPNGGKTKTKDLQDAVDHMQQSEDEELRIGDFEISEPTMLSIGDLDRYDDLGSWVELSDGELLEDRSALDSFRGSSWKRLAQGWTRPEDLPPIVIMETPTQTAIADGRGRTNYAIGMGWQFIPAVFAVHKKVASKHHPNGAGYYVWVVDSSSRPLAKEGPKGPYHTLEGAKPYARISATEGAHDRIISRGRDPRPDDFEIVRRYKARTGERVI